MTSYFFKNFALGIVIFFSSANATPLDYTSLQPSKETPMSIGSYSNGCLRGGIEVNKQHPYFQLIRPQNKRYFGTPNLVSFLDYLGTQAHVAGLPLLLVGDISMARGGPFTRGHASHQNGLDVDIWFRMTTFPLSETTLKNPSALTIVADDYKSVNKHYTKNIFTLIKLAALHKEVERIFVNATIKKQLCLDETNQDRTWLSKIRPWPGHTAHMHVRLYCPLQDPRCIPQLSVPSGDGCDEANEIIVSLNSAKTSNQTPQMAQKTKKVLPQECELLLNSNISDSPLKTSK